MSEVEEEIIEIKEEVKKDLPKFDLVKFAKKRKSYRLVVCGNTQCGKTYFLKDLTTKLQQYKKLKIYIGDIKYEFDKIATLRVPADLKMNNFKRKIRTIRCNGLDTSDPIDIIEFACAFAWHTHPSLVYIEEAEEVINVNSHLARQHPLVYKCLQQGASRYISVIACTQMISKLHKSFVRQSTDVFIFAVKERECRDIEKILALPKNTINFKMPEDLYRFYHLDSISDPVMYEKI